MLRGRVAEARRRVKKRLVGAFVEEYTPREVAVSFSVGVFITALPTLGAGLLIILALGFLFERLSKIAMLASVIPLNPVVKWGFYAASFSLGTLLLGPVLGVSFEGVSLSAGPHILARLWLGNLILATISAAVAYVVGLRLVLEFRERIRRDEVPVIDVPPELTAEE
ncbi:DUF2062 domain-containing protein [Halobacteriales archaeon SW_10_68_16]|jgi:uncharacterized protein (DUF2062 family)|nr:MAG: DUF2062 domain-containing protein [Halobacteriales archaeon SW_10_68_16]